MFTKPQLKAFFPVVARAWSEHATATGADPKDARSKDAFYRAELEKATGKTSVKDCRSGKDFEQAICHFEAIAGDSLHWQLTTAGSDKNRLLHVLHNLPADPAYTRKICLDKFGVADPKTLPLQHLHQLLMTVKNRTRKTAQTAP